MGIEAEFIHDVVACALTTASLFAICLHYLPSLLKRRNTAVSLNSSESRKPLIDSENPDQDHTLFDLRKSNAFAVLCHTKIILIAALVVCPAGIDVLRLSRGPISHTPLHIFTGIITMLAWIVSAVSVRMEYTLGEPHHSKCIVVWWFAALALDASKLYLHIHSSALQHGSRRNTLIGVVLECVLLVLSVPWCRVSRWPWEYDAVAQRANLDENADQYPRPSPSHQANFIERMTFFWAWPLLQVVIFVCLFYSSIICGHSLLPSLQKGFTKEGIRAEDLPRSPDHTLMETKCQQFMRAWKEEMEEKGGQASLIGVIVQVYGSWFMAQAIPCVVSECCSLLSPVLLKYVLEDVQSDTIDRERLVAYSVLFFCLAIVQALFVHNMWMNLVRVGLALRYDQLLPIVNDCT
jgi:hypothetical protein